jgi:peptide/nickel transport system substrate-binding protein
VTFDYPNYDFIGWNGARPPFDDPELRRALTLAIDRRGLVEELLYGYGRVSKGPLLSFWWSSNDAIEPWPHDPQAARELLAREGWSVVHEDGSRSEGRPLHVELITNAGNRLREQMLVKIQAQLSAVGVTTSVAVLEMRALRQRVGAGEFDGYLGGWVFDGKADLRSLFASDAVLPHGMNVVHYSSEEVDRLLAEADRAEDWRLLKPRLDAVQDRIHADQPYTFLYETRRVAAHGQRLEGVAIEVPSDPLAGLERYWIN